MMTDEMLDAKIAALYHTAFDPIHAGGTEKAGRHTSRRPLRGAVAAAVCMALLCAVTVGAGAASELRRWPSLFGGEIVEEELADDGAAVFSAVAQGRILPENCVAETEFDNVSERPAGTGSGAGAYILENGRIFVRRAGEAQDEDITDSFTGDSYTYTYTDPADGAPLTATVLGSCEARYTRYDGTAATVTLTRIADANSEVGYLIEYSNAPASAGFLYEYGKFKLRAAIELKYTILTPEYATSMTDALGREGN